jgi:hypothetical protein
MIVARLRRKASACDLAERAAPCVWLRQRDRLSMSRSVNQIEMTMTINLP